MLSRKRVEYHENDYLAMVKTRIFKPNLSDEVDNTLLSLPSEGMGNIGVVTEGKG